jgi:hypothetical protein
MSHTNRNFVFAYAFLVILPLIGLAGILRGGRSLKAPVSIDGLWNLQLDSAQLDSLPCGTTVAAAPDKTIAISQSGKTFVLSFPGGPKVIASGTVDGSAVRATIIPPSESVSGSSCSSGSELSLLAQVDRNADFRSLVGTLSVTNCPTCGSVGFRAERQGPAASKGGH